MAGVMDVSQDGTLVVIGDAKAPRLIAITLDTARGHRMANLVEFTLKYPIYSAFTRCSEGAIELLAMQSDAIQEYHIVQKAYVPGLSCAIRHKRGDLVLLCSLCVIA